MTFEFFEMEVLYGVFPALAMPQRLVVVMDSDQYGALIDAKLRSLGG